MIEGFGRFRLVESTETNVYDIDSEILLSFGRFRLVESTETLSLSSKKTREYVSADFDS